MVFKSNLWFHFSRLVILDDWFRNDDQRYLVGFTICHWYISRVVLHRGKAWFHRIEGLWVIRSWAHSIRSQSRKNRAFQFLVRPLDREILQGMDAQVPPWLWFFLMDLRPASSLVDRLLLDCGLRRASLAFKPSSCLVSFQRCPACHYLTLLQVTLMLPFQAFWESSQPTQLHHNLEIMVYRAASRRRCILPPKHQ